MWEKIATENTQSSNLFMLLEIREIVLRLFGGFFLSYFTFFFFFSRRSCCCCWTGTPCSKKYFQTNNKERKKQKNSTYMIIWAHTAYNIQYKCHSNVFSPFLAFVGVAVPISYMHIQTEIVVHIYISIYHFRSLKY